MVDDEVHPSLYAILLERPRLHQNPRVPGDIEICAVKHSAQNSMAQTTALVEPFPESPGIVHALAVPWRSSPRLAPKLCCLDASLIIRIGFLQRLNT